LNLTDLDHKIEAKDSDDEMERVRTREPSLEEWTSLLKHLFFECQKQGLKGSAMDV